MAVAEGSQTWAKINECLRVIHYQFKAKSESQRTSWATDIVFYFFNLDRKSRILGLRLN